MGWGEGADEHICRSLKTIDPENFIKFIHNWHTDFIQNRHTKGMALSSSGIK